MQVSIYISKKEKKKCTSLNLILYINDMYIDVQLEQSQKKTIEAGWVSQLDTIWAAANGWYSYL